MTDGAKAQPSRPRALFATEGKFRLLVVVGLVIYLMRQNVIFPEVFGNLNLIDNDDMMRLLSVRDWLAGQSWFDMTQYRLVPPEGVSMHWSRYVDAAIGALIVLFSIFTDVATAERLAVTAWPFLLFFAMLLLAGRFARSLFGVQGGSFALMSVGALSLYSFGYFAVGRIDHHNVQILAMLVLAYGAARPEAPGKAGLMAGLAGAVSLAVGLEAFPLIALAGVILVLRYVAVGGDERVRLAGFGLGLGGGALLLYAGQTAPATWGTAYCDQLSAPILWITTTAAAVCGVIYLSGTARDTVGRRLWLVGPMSVLAVAVLLKQMSFCSAGPYANLPEDIRAITLARIPEARPAWVTLMSQPVQLIDQILPLFLTLLAAVTAYVLRRRAGVLRPGETHAVAVLIGLLAGAFLMTAVHLRAVVVAYGFLPLAFAYAVMGLLDPASPLPRMRKPLSVLVIVGVLLSSTIVALGMAGWSYATPPAAAPSDAADTAATAGGDGTQGTTETSDLGVNILDWNCRQPKALALLNDLPPGTILGSLNVGSGILLHTHHTALAAPYHRSTPAMTAGSLPFYVSADTFEAEVRATGADYLLLCRNAEYGPKSSQARQIAEGATAPNWLERIDLDHPDMMVYRIAPAGQG